MFTFIGRKKRVALISYVKIFLLFVAIVMAANIATSSLMFVNSEQHSVKLVRTYSTEELSQISYSTNFMFEAAKMTLLQLYSNPSVLKLMNQTDLGELETASLLSQVGLVKINLPFVNSIYIYNSRAQRMYFDGKAFPAASFPDQEIVQRLKSGAVDNLRPIARRIKSPGNYTSPVFDEEQKDDVYSFVFYDSKSSQIDNAIVLNVSQSWLKNTIDSMDPRTSGDTVIADSAGLIALGNDRFGYLDRISDYPEFGSVLNRVEASGYAVKTIDGQKYLITYVSSPILNWKFIRFTPYEAVSGKLKQLLTWTLIIFLAVTFMSVLAVLFISKFVYGLFSSKLHEMERKFDREKNAGYEKKQQFLRALAAGKMEEGVLHKRLARYGIQFRLDIGFMTVLFKIDRYERYCDRYSLEDRALLSYGMINVIGELTAPFFTHEAVDLGEGCICLLINTDAVDSAEFAGRTEELVKDIQEKIKQYLGLSLSASLGEGLEEIDEIPGSVDLCKEALDYRLFYGPRALIYVSGIKELKKKEFVFFEQIVTHIIEALLAGDGESVRQHCNRLIESTRGYSVASLQTTLLRLAIAMREGMQKYPMLADELHYGPFIDMANHIANFETLDEISDKLNELFAGLLNVVLHSQKSVKKYERYSGIMHEVQSFVEREFANPNLNPELIAEQFDLSARYLRTLYMKASGESLGEYITRYRLDQAKRLLDHAEMTVQEAAIRSGFANINYFYTLFKKYNGITPNEFRSLASSDPPPSEGKL
ncbi:AraC family transcriptional regulator [Cohnella sp. GCM10020058]|uniref:AraC family transcriptional regulator n=1 Tax=Cohnella sp. GCM10020058 TaxID=3317330 RepID=UPI003639CD26